MSGKAMPSSVNKVAAASPSASSSKKSPSVLSSKSHQTHLYVSPAFPKAAMYSAIRRSSPAPASPSAKKTELVHDTTMYDSEVSVVSRYEPGLVDSLTRRPFYYDYETCESRWGDPPKEFEDHDKSSLLNDEMKDFVVELDQTDRVVILKDQRGRKYRYDRETCESRWIDGK